MEATIIALWLAAVGSPAVALEPQPTAKLYCEYAPGSALPLETAVWADVITAYEEKAGWRPWVQTLSPTTFRIGFSPNARPSDTEIAFLNAETHLDGLVVRSIEYRIDGEVEEVSGGSVCLRLVGLLG